MALLQVESFDDHKCDSVDTTLAVMQLRSSEFNEEVKTYENQPYMIPH